MRWLSLFLFLSLAACGTKPSFARDDGQWTRNPDPEIHQWFQDVKQPPSDRVSCCAEADAFEADQLAGDNPDGSFQVVITNGRGIWSDGKVVTVNKGQIQTHFGNPTGHIVVFLNSNGQVLCYVPLPLG